MNRRKLQAFLMGIILMISGMIACTDDPRAKWGNREEALVVRNWKGDYLGSARLALLDPYTGNVTFIILLLDKEKKEVVIPLSSFSAYDRGNATLILGVSKEILVAAPEFHLSDLEDPAFTEKIYRFFGRAPSWTDGATGGERKIAQFFSSCNKKCHFSVYF